MAKCFFYVLPKKQSQLFSVVHIDCIFEPQEGTISSSSSLYWFIFDLTWMTTAALFKTCSWHSYSFLQVRELNTMTLFTIPLVHIDEHYGITFRQ